MGLLIKTKVKESKIQGEGLFTLEYIKKGQIIFEDSDLTRIKESTYNQLNRRRLRDYLCWKKLPQRGSDEYRQRCLCV